MKTTSTLPRIRPATPEDCDELFQLSQEFVTSGALRYRPRSQFEAWVEDFLTAEHDGRVVGCLGVRCLADAPGQAVLYNFCVSPDYHGRGLGSRMVTAAADRAIGSGVRLLYTATTRRDNWFLRQSFRWVAPADAPAGWVASLDPARNSLLYVCELARRELVAPGGDRSKGGAPR